MIRELTNYHRKNISLDISPEDLRRLVLKIQWENIGQSWVWNLLKEKNNDDTKLEEKKTQKRERKAKEKKTQKRHAVPFPRKKKNDKLFVFNSKIFLSSVFIFLLASSSSLTFCCLEEWLWILLIWQRSSIWSSYYEGGNVGKLYI